MTTAEGGKAILLCTIRHLGENNTVRVTILVMSDQVVPKIGISSGIWNLPKNGPGFKESLTRLVFICQNLFLHRIAIPPIPGFHFWVHDPPLTVRVKIPNMHLLDY